MTCVTTVQYSILVNGQESKAINPTSGLREGDPLSPYLFLLCTEGFTLLLKEAESKRAIKGVKVSKGGTSINHLLFAYDCIIFCKPELQQWRALEAILSRHEEASGHKLNLHKTSLYFSSNTKSKVRGELTQVTGARECGDVEKYLGLRTMVGKSKYKAIRGIREKVWQRISSWKNQFL